jgi:RES domain-containing protein
MVLVSAETKLDRVLDLREGKCRQRLRLSAKTIKGCNWRKDNGSGQEALTQAFGWALEQAGAEALLVPSCAARTGSILVVFNQNLCPASNFKVTKEVVWPGK